MSSPHRMQATPQLLRATLARSRLKVILHRWTWRSLLTTLLDRWGLQVLILAQDSLLTKDTLDNHSMVGRGGPLLGLCMGNLLKTQVSGDTQQRAMQILANSIHNGNRRPNTTAGVFGGRLTLMKRSWPRWCVWIAIKLKRKTNQKVVVIS